MEMITVSAGAVPGAFMDAGAAGNDFAGNSTDQADAEQIAANSNEIRKLPVYFK